MAYRVLVDILTIPSAPLSAPGMIPQARPALALFLPSYEPGRPALSQAEGPALFAPSPSTSLRVSSAEGPALFTLSGRALVGRPSAGGGAPPKGAKPKETPFSVARGRRHAPAPRRAWGSPLPGDSSLRDRARQGLDNCGKTGIIAFEIVKNLTKACPPALGRRDFVIQCTKCPRPGIAGQETRSCRTGTLPAPRQPTEERTRGRSKLLPNR
jgi:hypothetical protein